MGRQGSERVGKGLMGWTKFGWDKGGRKGLEGTERVARGQKGSKGPERVAMGRKGLLFPSLFLSLFFHFILSAV